uniref:phosphoribosylaminoimidazolesuccinocarboxamide synthase n=1 Tax=Aplanochytrium stocchinoi TaxID=215587 RepID=A0A7S3LP26_9STRA|mmetsp:Transcript_6834/g.8303  ORF Transcript_6834/g.8303 Transcript_6834/m.8303 type:complete len:373 (-) Transcript_6834:211-1329(-)|eukprot:CAMPEP_0204837968 /NCGR_PEP_ID=MMETSP1346-20131115/29415_1 /ASSEMBLY_ACC=CAM_ASM_000771 /TAXON_ID=215587 /ORGANISM="Aplanochytrium stocchinoi, Strain GSBS06" /LENGTH=372 /DNA_ID=CAMNT_0051973713 /DNA_START=36 /DNA_END=1154 /DNA_ORIENTATION=+
MDTMLMAEKVLSVNDDLPIKTTQKVHSGKVRSVYWLTDEDSRRLIEEKGYNVVKGSKLAVMIISDRLSAFECIWKAEGGITGVPGKGSALNAIANYWFKMFKQNGLADSHILDVPHPLVWIVQKAEPVLIEAIIRAYITGSMWRSYAKGERVFCGIQLGNDLKKDTKLPELLLTPSTKGVIKGVPGVPEVDDVNVSRETIIENYKSFNFKSPEDISIYEKLLKEGFSLISSSLSQIGKIFVDTKFEFGYVKDNEGNEKLIYMDEVGTPDSSRIWEKKEYLEEGKVMERSKEYFRQMLLEHFKDEGDVLVNKDRMDERNVLAQENELPVDIFMKLSQVYQNLAYEITGEKITLSDNPRKEIIEILKSQYDLIV